MKMKSMFRYAPLLAVIAGCDADLFTQRLNDKAQPAVEDVLIANTFDTGELTSDEGAQFVGLLDLSTEPEGGAYPIFAWQYPQFKFNKLLNGETIEIVEKNEDTGAEQSQCKMVDGAFTIAVGQTPSTNPIRACYNPGTLVVTVQSSDDTNTAVNFLPYDTTFTYTATANIQDKYGHALDEKAIKLHTQPFQVLTVTAGKTVVYGGSFFDTAAPTGPTDAAVFELVQGASSSGLFRILFSGPVHGDEAIASLAGVQLLKNDSTPQTVTGPSGDISAVVAFALGEETLSEDERIVYLVTPEYQASEGQEGLAPGSYKIVIPATVTDDGSVTGSPVALGGDAIEIPLLVVPKRTSTNVAGSERR